MKFSRGFSILILFCILPSFAFAVTCPTHVSLDVMIDSSKKRIEINGSINELEIYTGSKTCDACVYYYCGIEAPVSAGCPEDFYDKCSKYSSDINFIKSKSPNNMDYANGTIEYVSGCGGEDDGRDCLKKHVVRFSEEIFTKKVAGKYNEGNLVWHDRSGSNGQNGAFKFIGIIVFGWILFAAAWIY